MSNEAPATIESLTSENLRLTAQALTANAERNAAVEERDKLAARVDELAGSLRTADDLNAILHEENAALRASVPAHVTPTDEPAAVEHVTDADVAAPPWPSGSSFDLPK